MDLKKQINRALIAIDAYFIGLKKDPTNMNKNKKSVLIVFQQLFGDAIVIQNSLVEYTKLFPYQEGYRIKFLARPIVLAFMKETVEIPSYIETCEVDFKKFLENFLYYKKIVKEYKGTAEILIVPGTSLSAEIFAIANDAKRKIGLVRSVDIRKPIVMVYFAKHAYTESVRPKKESMMLQRHRLLLNYLGDEDYQAKLPTLLPQKRIINEEHYCVMCPGSSKTEKCWPIERFAEVSDYIVEKYNMNIHICGGADEIEFVEKILSQVRYPERVISHVGKTSFSNWSAIVQHSDLVVGNDSATIHLAAASRRKSVCIAGVYDKYQFFPYKVDRLDEGDCLPFTLIKEMSCEWCRTFGYDAGFGNEECRKRINSSQCACCIDKITIQDVENQIDLIMN